jgi:uroporphyrinogen-III synthase
MILTSQRSAESVKKAVVDLPGAWQDKRHYCVGMKTAETAATLLGLKNLAGQDCGNAENLSSLIVQGLIKKKDCFICVNYYHLSIIFRISKWLSSIATPISVQ